MRTSRRSTSWAGWWRRSSAAFRSVRSPTPPTRCSRSTTAARRILVGVNDFTEGEGGELELHRVDPALERKQTDRVQAVRARRDSEAVESALSALREAAAGDANLMANLLDCARVHATEGEIIASLQQVFGVYTETPVF